MGRQLMAGTSAATFLEYKRVDVPLNEGDRDGRAPLALLQEPVRLEDALWRRQRLGRLLGTCGVVWGEQCTCEARERGQRKGAAAQRQRQAAALTAAAAAARLEAAVGGWFASCRGSPWCPRSPKKRVSTASLGSATATATSGGRSTCDAQRPKSRCTSGAPTSAASGSGGVRHSAGSEDCMRHRVYWLLGGG